MALTNLGIQYETVGFSEIDKYAVKSYCAIHGVSEGLNLGDITKIDLEQLPECDLITHGSPCQDFSVAGNQAGGDVGTNTRSSLMWNSVEIIRRCRPKFVIWENVKNVLSKKHRHNFDQYIQSLEEIGYTSYYQVLNAKNYGIPQNRERIFCISIRKDIDKGFEFPKPFDNGIRLKDLLEDKVDEKFYISDEKVEKLLMQLKNNQYLNKNAIYTPFENCVSYPLTSQDFVRTGFNENCPTLSARDYKDPKCVCVGNVNPSGNGMNGNVYAGEIAPTLTTNKGEGNKVLVVGRINSSQDGLIISTEGVSPTHTAGHGNCPKVCIPCLTPDRLEKRQNDRRFKDDGEPMFTLTSQDRHGVLIKQATKEGHIPCEIGGVFEGSFPDSKTRRGRVQDGGNTCPTIQCSNEILRVEENTPCRIGNIYGDNCGTGFAGNVWNKEHISPALTTMQGGGRQPMIVCEQRCDEGLRFFKDNVCGSLRTIDSCGDKRVIDNYRIRKLTPKECFRLMGFSDKDFQKCVDIGMSNSQLYKQAGNSIVVNVLEEIFKILNEIYLWRVAA